MSGTTMIVLIVFISVGFGVLNKMLNTYLAHKKTHNSEEKKALENEINALKERVSTLEKIVTDEGYTLKKEFNNL